MTADDLRLRVDQHYQSTSDPLLLSELGMVLKEAGLWPPEGEKRSLAEFVRKDCPTLTLVRDPEAKAFVVVVPTGKENLAEAAIRRRQKLQLLRHLPRSVLLAFCVKTGPGTLVYLRLEPPHLYQFENPSSDPSLVAIEEEFRSPGLFIDYSRHMELGAAERLIDGIRSWADRHNVALNLLAGKDEATRAATPAPPVPEPKYSNALERLYAAQPPALSGRLVVPLDIALTLSRMP